MRGLLAHCRRTMSSAYSLATAASPADLSSWMADPACSTVPGLTSTGDAAVRTEVAVDQRRGLTDQREKAPLEPKDRGIPAGKIQSPAHSCSADEACRDEYWLPALPGAQWTGDCWMAHYFPLGLAGCDVTWMTQAQSAVAWSPVTGRAAVQPLVWVQA